MKWFGPGYANEMVSRKLWKEPELCNFVFNFLYVFKKCIYKAVKCTNVQSFTSFQHLIFYNFSSDMENIRGGENYPFFTNFFPFFTNFQVKRSLTNIKCDYAVLTFYFLSKFQQNRANNVRVRTERYNEPYKNVCGRRRRLTTQVRIVKTQTIMKQRNSVMFTYCILIKYLHFKLYIILFNVASPYSTILWVPL